MPKTKIETTGDKDERPTGRDARVDQIGFAEELADLAVANLRKDVKASGITRGLYRITGDFFEGTLAGGEPGRAIDAKKFLALCKQKGIKPAASLVALAVNKTAAATILSGEEIESISYDTPAKEKSLTIKLRKGVEITLTQALYRVAADVKARAAA